MKSKLVAIALLFGVVTLLFLDADLRHFLCYRAAHVRQTYSDTLPILTYEVLYTKRVSWFPGVDELVIPVDSAEARALTWGRSLPVSREVLPGKTVFLFELSGGKP